MAYEPEKEKEIRTEEVEFNSTYAARGKLYTYGGGEPKFKILFVTKRRNGTSFFTSKMPAITTQEEAQKLKALLTSFEGELKK